MSEETNTSSEEERQLTPEEIEQSRKNLTKFYTEQNKLLKLQSEFHKLKADIAEDDARELMWIIRKAQMLQGPTQASDPENTGDGKGERKLKTD